MAKFENQSEFEARIKQNSIPLLKINKAKSKIITAFQKAGNSVDRRKEKILSLAKSNKWKVSDPGRKVVNGTGQHTTMLPEKDGKIGIRVFLDWGSGKNNESDALDLTIN